MQFVEWIGALAALASTASFAPQALKIIRTRQTKDISTGMYLLTVSAFAAWTLYGAMLGRWPLIAANSICFLLSAFILTMKLLPRAKKEAVADAITLKEE
jgi:MtN3 and saliva related transmembrane protein